VRGVSSGALGGPVVCRLFFAIFALFSISFFFPPQTGGGGFFSGWFWGGVWVLGLGGVVQPPRGPKPGGPPLEPPGPFFGSLFGLGVFLGSRQGTFRCSNRVGFFPKQNQKKKQHPFFTPPFPPCLPPNLPGGFVEAQASLRLILWGDKHKKHKTSKPVFSSLGLLGGVPV